MREDPVANEPTYREKGENRRAHADKCQHQGCSEEDYDDVGRQHLVAGASAAIAEAIPPHELPGRHRTYERRADPDGNEPDRGCRWEAVQVGNMNYAQGIGSEP